MKLHESGENYLETILILKKVKPAIRAVDIGAELGYSKSSVSRAVNLLKTEGLITVGEDGIIEFTDSGKTIAEQTYRRHCALTRFFIRLGVDSVIAEKDACRIEHDISGETFAAIEKFLGDAD